MNNGSQDERQNKHFSPRSQREALWYWGQFFSARRYLLHSSVGKIKDEAYNAILKKKKGVTIDDLAVMTRRGFSETHGHFTEIDKQFDHINANFKQVDSSLKDVNVRLDRIENLLIRAHENRLEKVEDDIRILKTLVKQR